MYLFSQYAYFYFFFKLWSQKYLCNYLWKMAKVKQKIAMLVKLCLVSFIKLFFLFFFFCFFLSSCLGQILWKCESYKSPWISKTAHKLCIRWFNGSYDAHNFVVKPEKFTRLLNIWSAIFNNILCSVKCEKHSFAHFWNVCQNPKMRPCWPANQGERSDRLISIVIK